MMVNTKERGTVFSAPNGLLNLPDTPPESQAGGEEPIWRGKRPGSVVRAERTRNTIVVSLFLIAVSAIAVFLSPAYWYAWSLIPLIGGSLFLRMICRAGACVYCCLRCGAEFEVSPLWAFASPSQVGIDNEGNLLEWKYLKCPTCKRPAEASLRQTRRWRR